MKTLNKMLEQSHWRAIQSILLRIPEWKLSRGRLDRIVVSLTKILLVTPSFLNEAVFMAFRHIILCSRKKL
jgi:hypothetical protein